MVAQRRRRSANIRPALGQRVVFAGHRGCFSVVSQDMFISASHGTYLYLPLTGL